MVSQDNRKETSSDRTAETTPAGISWVQYAHCRKKFKQRWPSIWHLKVVTNPFVDVLRHVVNPGSVLDVGATDKVWKPLIQNLWPNILYRSLDIDRTNEHDYYSFDDVDMEFDLVICFEVLEHVKPPELIKIIEQCISVCKRGKYIMYSVPNLFSDSFWMDFTHYTALSFWDLPTLMSWCGLEVVKGSRWFMGTAKQKLIHQYLIYPLHRAVSKDFCHSVLMLGRKPLEHVARE